MNALEMNGKNRLQNDNRNSRIFAKYEDLIESKHKFHKYLKQKSQDVNQHNTNKMNDHSYNDKKKEEIYRILDNELIKDRKVNTNYGRKRTKKEGGGSLDVNCVIQTGFNLNVLDDSMCQDKELEEYLEDEKTQK